MLAPCVCFKTPGQGQDRPGRRHLSPDTPGPSSPCWSRDVVQPDEWEVLPSAMQRSFCWSRIPCQHNKQPLAGVGSKWWQMSCLCIGRHRKSYLEHNGGCCVKHVQENQSLEVELRSWVAWDYSPRAIGCGTGTSLPPHPICCALSYTFSGCIPSLKGGRPCFVFMSLRHSDCTKLFSINPRLCPQCWVWNGSRTVALEMCSQMACRISGRDQEALELCFRTDLGLNPSSSTATHLTLSVFLNHEELQFLHV